MGKPKCFLCETRRGKRACPARGGALICPPCCARHRVTDLDCPPDCSYLGAEGSLLLARKRPSDTPRASHGEIIGLIETLGIFGADPGRDAAFEEAAGPVVAEFFKLMDAVAAQEQETGLEDIFHEWLLMGARRPDGSPVLDQMLTGLTRPLEPRELAALGALHQSEYRLLALEEILDEETVRVRDHLSGQTETLRAPQVAETFAPGETICGFVTPTDQGLIVLLGAIALPRGGEEAVVSRLRELHGDSPLGDRPFSEFLCRLSLTVPLVLQQHVADRQVEDDLFEGPPSF